MQVLVLDDRGDLLAHVLGVDDDDLLDACGGLALDDGQGRRGYLRLGGERRGDVHLADDAFFGDLGARALEEVGGLEADLVEHALHDGVQAARADVLGGLVDAEGELRHLLRGLRG